MDQTPDEVYAAAATASVRTEGVNDGYIADTAREEPFRAAVNAAYAAGRQQAAAALPTGSAEILAWLARHGLSTTPGVGVVLAAVRADLTP